MATILSDSNPCWCKWCGDYLGEPCEESPECFKRSNRSIPACNIKFTLASSGLNTVFRE